MSKSSETGLVGIDGGGTSCRIALEWRGLRTEVVLGSANVTTDFCGAVQLIRKGLKDVAAKAGLFEEDLQVWPAYLGLAGVVDEADAQAVAEALPLKAVVVEDDRRAAVVGALGDVDGTVAGVGTGSFLARRSSASLRLVGGWGVRLGDEASGAWLGHRLLASALDVVDGLEDETGLTADIFQQFGKSARQIVAFSLEAGPADYADFAPRVIEAAKADDRTGRRLMNEGANYLSRTMDKLGWQEREPVCLIGGVAPHYRDYLPEPVALSLVSAKGTALDGALQLAAVITPHDGRMAP